PSTGRGRSSGRRRAGCSTRWCCCRNRRSEPGGGGMDALTLDDLLPPEEFAGRRKEFWRDHQRYLDRYRRVRLGPRLTLVFENRQTLWFRVREVLRVARLGAPALVQRELDLYNRLLPGPGRLQAALLLTVEVGRWAEELAWWQGLRGEELCLLVGGAR